MVRPFGGDGRCCASTQAGSAAAIAALNKDRNKARGSSIIAGPDPLINILSSAGG
jgi:hypothetical protein